MLCVTELFMLSRITPQNDKGKDKLKFYYKQNPSPLF